ncbi:MAG TPA: MarR family winged helix-turn-helix transcriptional regulator [bacterium]|nr:MarR family winged helix-turn-helix transcriptional regulator [bacterium]HPV65510.1 MarR family winged helix-turn-helix transcriptional regulator [bacterium]
MQNVNESIKFFINLSKTQSILSDRFDRGLGGLSFNEFLILFYLVRSENQKMRRVDIADKVGLTASGVTRILLPMEKVHLIESGPVEDDARVRFVGITEAGEEKLKEALDRLEILAEEIISPDKKDGLKNLSDLLIEIGGKVLMN